MSRTPSRGPRQDYSNIHCDAGQRSDYLQSGTIGAGCTVHGRGRVCGGGSDNEGGSRILLQHDAGAGLRYDLRQRAAVYR